MELLGYIREEANRYSIPRLIKEKIALRFTSEEEIIKFIHIRDKYNIHGCSERVWKKNIDDIEDYGIAIVFYNTEGTGFTTIEGYYEKKGYRTVNYSEVEILWNY
jgi:hypothetical protein